jgi:hypothetical protein
MSRTERQRNSGPVRQRQSARAESNSGGAVCGVGTRVEPERDDLSAVMAGGD